MSVPFAVRALGRGLGLPLRADDSGALPITEGEARVEQSMLVILDTEPGERVQRPTWGCGLRRYLMKPNTAGTRALMRADIERALRAWEPRAQIVEVRVDAGEEPSLVLITIEYRVPPGPSPRTLVYPFYLE